MLEIGVQTKDVVEDANPAEGFRALKEAGFTCCDFGLNAYLKNRAIYEGEGNSFYDKTDAEFEAYFRPHKEAAKEYGIRINQMHMPYPILVPNGEKELNDYLWNVVAPKCMKICAFFECKNIVVHGLKMERFLGDEESEWKRTEEFLEYLAPMAKEMGITLCIENLYNGLGSHMAEGPCCNARKAAERIDRMNDKFGAEVLGFCFDTGHANLVGLDFEDFLTTLGHRLKVLHMHDNDGERDLHQIPFVFTKTRENKPSTDWDGFVRGMRKIGFDQVLSFETAPVLTSFPEEMRMDALSMIARIGRYFKEKIEE